MTVCAGFAPTNAYSTFERERTIANGIHTCTLFEVRERFGRFQMSDQHVHLFQRLEAFVAEAKESRIVRALDAYLGLDAFGGHGQFLEYQPTRGSSP